MMMANNREALSRNVFEKVTGTELSLVRNYWDGRFQARKLREKDARLSLAALKGDRGQ